MRGTCSPLNSTQKSKHMGHLFCVKSSAFDEGPGHHFCLFLQFLFSRLLFKKKISPFSSISARNPNPKAMDQGGFSSVGKQENRQTTRDFDGDVDQTSSPLLPLSKQVRYDIRVLLWGDLFFISF